MERAFGISKDCFVVRGYLRSAIYDTRRQAYSLIDNGNADELPAFVGKSEAYVREHMNPELLQFLLDQEFAYFWPAGLLQQFTDISLACHHPFPLDNAILEGTGLRVFEALGWLLKAGCRHFLIILHGAVSLEALDTYLANVHFGTIPTLDLYLDKLTGATTKKTKDFIHKYSFVASICIHNASRDQFFIENQIPVAITKKPMSNLAPVKSPDVFFTNLQLFIESKHHNPYFHRKIYVGRNGEIRNAPDDPRIFGNINDIVRAEQIVQIVEDPDFQRYWDINKDKIDVCRDCEFRYMCVDARLPVQRADGSWYFSAECEYNPYICKWEDEEDFRNLEDSGVQCNQNGLQADTTRLRDVRQEIWGPIFQD